MAAFVDLNAMEQVCAGVIVLLPTGVEYNLQTGGTACRQRQAVGVFLPLEGHDLSEEPEMEAIQNKVSLDTKDIVRVHNVCTRLGIPFTPDPAHAAYSGEAWIYGTITENKGLLTNMAGCHAVLVYDNSD